MPKNLRKKQEKIQEILEYLAEESKRGIPIIVEGKKDVETLRAFQVEGEIIAAKTGRKSRLDVISQIEKAGTKEIILMLDFDRRGKEWTKHLTTYLERTRIKPNVTFWNELSAIVRREVKDIEGLATYIETLKRKIGNSA
ncbi:toprim domain-containing protein [Candidatus Bathyarchaeota archaeon]|nr:toprim domain-containing protein [Candidatus Bathyarchaeota archaeon]